MYARYYYKENPVFHLIIILMLNKQLILARLCQTETKVHNSKMDPLKQLSVSQQFKRADDDKHIYLLLNRLQPQPDLLAAYVRVAMADLAAVMRQTKTAKAKIMNYGSSASGLFMMGKRYIITTTRIAILILLMTHRQRFGFPYPYPKY